MAAEGKVTNSLEAAACPIKTKLNPVRRTIQLINYILYCNTAHVH